VGTHGTVVPLPEQDRRRWDAARIAEGTALVERALRRGGAGPYAVQAAIAALHAAAPDFEATDWPQIAALYGELLRRAPSPVVAVNRAVAVGFARGPEAGLRLLGDVAGDRALRDYAPLHAARAELLRRAGERDDADAAYARAIACTANAAQRADLERRRAALGRPEREPAT
jgi:RNA polymerase sigma-70 factor (ECF subfamily)